MNAPAADSSPSNLIKLLSGLEKREYAAVAWSFLYFFCVLASYYILRPVRDEMAVVSGSHTIPWLFTGTFFVMLLATPVFGWITSRFPRRQFLPWVYLFFIVNILIFAAIFSFYLANGFDQTWLARVFFVWASVFNLFVVSVFWSFMADIYTREQGRRLFGLITSGGTIGAIVAGKITKEYLEDVGFPNLLFISAVLLTAAIPCIRQLRHWVLTDAAPNKGAPEGKLLGGSPLAGVTHMVSSPYFLSIGFISLIASLLGTALYMFAANLLEQSDYTQNQRILFYNDINYYTNWIALIGQFFAVRLIVQYLGIGVTLAVLPVISIVGFVVLAINPSLGLVALLTIVRRGVGFGLTKPTTDMLYSVVTPEEKYKTKNFIDTAIYRAGDLVGTWSIRGLMSGLGMALAAVSWVMVPFAAIWAGVGIWLGRDYRRRAKQQREESTV